MRVLTVDARRLERKELERRIAATLRDQPDTTVVKLCVLGPLAGGAQAAPAPARNDRQPPLRGAVGATTRNSVGS